MEQNVHIQVIAFNLEQDDKGELNLRVRAWATSWVPDAVNKNSANTSWKQFSENLATNIYQNQCHGRPKQC
ncbi:MAG: hypothetical protein ABW215_19520 [Kibdelosporangium sp.]